MRFLTAFIALLAFAAAASAEAPAPAAGPPRPLPAVRRVVIISVDGLRPDRLLLADAPNLRALIKDGAYTMWARTTAVAITLPSHASMLTGVTPGKHGIEWNRDLFFKKPVYPAVPTVFELATRAGYSTAMAAGKSKFAALNRPGTISHVFVSDHSTGTDDEVAAEALKIIAQHKPDLLFAHFPDVDTVGHAKGWGSPEQSAVITAADRHIGEILATLERTGVRESTAVIVSADHGGAGHSHGHVGPDDARSRHIPWIINGPGVRRGFDLTQIESLQVNTEDTCATACWLLGLARPEYFDGKVITAAFEGME